MRDRDAALAAARAAINKMPQYQGKNDSDQHNPHEQMQKQGNPFQPQPDPMAAAPNDANQFQLMKLYHLLGTLSYELYGDPQKWQEGHIEAFFEDMKNAIRRGKSLNTNKMKAMLKRGG